MIRYAESKSGIIYQSIDVEGRPAVDCLVIVIDQDGGQRQASVLNWGESQTFYQSIREWMLQLPTGNNKERGQCRDIDVTEMLRQYLAYERKFVPPPTEKQIKTEQMEWSE